MAAVLALAGLLIPGQPDRHGRSHYLRCHRVGDDLDPDSPDPLYEQLAALLRQDIDAGRITARLPSEMTLTQRYGVSRDTAHRAVMILIEAGDVRISRGRARLSSRPASVARSSYRAFVPRQRRGFTRSR